MKIAIGDIHGRTNWKAFLEEPFSEAYFLGDYFDDYENTPTVYQVENFKRICEAARADNRIHLCLGNHDLHYLKGCEGERYSGFQRYGRFDIQEALEANFDLLKPIYKTGNILLSHAGITKTFMEEIHETDPLRINERFVENRMLLAHAGWDSFGDSVHDGPVWVRPRSLLSDKLEGFLQVVGHTYQDMINTIDGVTFVDTDNKDIYRFGGEE